MKGKPEMKKTIAFVLAFIMTALFSACAAEEKVFETMDVQALENSNISRTKKSPNFNLIF